MADRLAAFDRSDKARFAREEALNILESYTYQVRDFLGNGDHETVSSQSHRDEISSLLESTREWIEDAKEVAKATKEDFQDKLGSLKKLVEPIQKRKIELESRPAKIEALNSKLADAKEWMSRVQESVAAAASSASSAVESPSEAVDDLEDAVPEALKGFTPPNPFVESDASGISDVYERVSSWLAEATESQAKLTPDQEPFFTSRDVDSYIAELDRSISSLSNKATRAAREALAAFEKAQKASKKASTKTKSSTSTGSASVVSGAAEEPSTAPEPIPEEAAPEAENDVPPAVEESEEEKENHDEL